MASPSTHEGTLLEGLDPQQKKAVRTEANAVVTAGAGSGKTRVLASRYAYLICEKNLGPEEILSLTFTNKAVSEMYSRMYRYLLDEASAGGPGAKRALAALGDFHKARISTLDSFSAHVARTGAARYGISPDFKSDDGALKNAAQEAALRFVLDQRQDPVIGRLLEDHKIRTIAEDIFALYVLEYSPISKPLDLDAILSRQKELLRSAWTEKTRRLEDLTHEMRGLLVSLRGEPKPIKMAQELDEIMQEAAPPVPDLGLFLSQGSLEPPEDLSRALGDYAGYYQRVIAVRSAGTVRDSYRPLIEIFREIKGDSDTGLLREIQSIANYILYLPLCGGLFALLERFQENFARQKRESGLLSFNDIAHLAVDVLSEHPDIRRVYKDSLKMIMIDEFQDNNSLQRDLIYLLAEDSARMEKGIPSPEDLLSNRMFFVGDEKQSIYRFRGADVAVFRSLGDGLAAHEPLDLPYNYRSRPLLIEAFNYLFQKVFPPQTEDLPSYEAVYRGILPPSTGAGEGSLVEFCFLNPEDIPEDDTGFLSSQDLEAVFIARTIRDLVDKGSYAYGDFVVLQRSYTHQGLLEKHFREFGVPYSADRPAGLFNEAPVLDLRAYLRLLQYPEDTVAYGALIRSPFMRLGDQTLAVCLLGALQARREGRVPEPFTIENDPLIPAEDLPLYRRARERFTAIRSLSRQVPVTELITLLWYGEAYRMETLWSEAAQVYEGLFDLFFSLADEIDRRGQGLAEFISYLDDIMNRQEKSEDRDIPPQGKPGVRFMSIHKSKGLEFPVVFLFNCSSAGNSRPSSDLLELDPQRGLVFKIPLREDLPLGGNYLRKLFNEEEKAKDIAELRRLLYVAMTRAESRLYLSFTLPAQTKAERESWDASAQPFTEESLALRLEQLIEKEVERQTFLTLLLPGMIGCPPGLCSFTLIPPLTRAEVRDLARKSQDQDKRASRLSQPQRALEAARAYEGAQIIPPGKAWPLYYAASGLRAPGAEDITKDTPYAPSPGYLFEGQKIDGILRKADLFGEFGTLVHEILEDSLEAGSLKIDPERQGSWKKRDKIEAKDLEEIFKAAALCAENFLSSPLGKRCAATPHRELEFGIMSSTPLEGRKALVMGRIDLLFEEEDAVVVVDFKTDRRIQKEEHLAQLGIYAQAAGDIFGKPVRAYIFYLCFPPDIGTVDCSGDLEGALSLS